LWGVGQNGRGQLGLGNTDTQQNWAQLAEGVDSAGCSYRSTYILKGGELWSTGHNDFGQLGLGNTTDQAIFQNTGVTEVVSIQGGYHESHIIKTNGTVWSAGRNNHGQLGLGHINNQSNHQLINISNIKKISSGYGNTKYLKNDGTIWSAGYNAYGQLMLGDSTQRSDITQIPITNVKDVVSGIHHTLILKEDGVVMSAGYNGFGGLGVGDKLNRETPQSVATGATAVYAHSYSSFYVKGGELWGTGRNDLGNLALGNSNLIDHTTFQNSGVLAAKVFMGDNHSMIEKSDKSLWSLGHNSYYQLGLGDSVNRAEFTEVVIP